MFQSLGVVILVDKFILWVSSVGVVTKKLGVLRVCIDFRLLNVVFKRERYQFFIFDDILFELVKVKVFLIVDLRLGYWYCILDKDFSFFVIFVIFYYRYLWCRFLFGFFVFSEIFQKRVNQVLEGLDGVLDIIDDILIYGVGNIEDEVNVDYD